jgi:hypothetical protein
MQLTQKYQMASGALKNGNNTTPITNGRLRGDQITFTAGSTTYTGRVDGNTMAGTTSTGVAWRATRSLWSLVTTNDQRPTTND